MQNNIVNFQICYRIFILNNWYRSIIGCLRYALVPMLQLLHVPLNAYENDYLNVFLTHRNCLDIILRKVETVPDYFEIFCAILKTDSYFTAFLESVTVCFAVYSSETEIRECININSLLVHISDNLNCDE